MVDGSFRLQTGVGDHEMEVRMRQSIQILCFLAVFAAVGWSQPTATIVGRISDPSGAAMAGAKITARNTSTGLERSTVATESGDYELPLLPISGVYTVS